MSARDVGGKFNESLGSRGSPPGSASEPLRDLADASAKSARIREIEQRIEAGGGEKAVAKLHARGKHTGWERIEMLVDAVVGHHHRTLGADYAASKGWYDAIVQPEDLRRALVREVSLMVEHFAAVPVEGRRSISLT